MTIFIYKSCIHLSNPETRCPRCSAFTFYCYKTRITVNVSSRLPVTASIVCWSVGGSLVYTPSLSRKVPVCYISQWTFCRLAQLLTHHFKKELVRHHLLPRSPVPPRATGCVVCQIGRFYLIKAATLNDRFSLKAPL